MALNRFANAVQDFRKLIHERSSSSRSMAVLVELEVRPRARVAFGRHRQFGSLVVVIPHDLARKSRLGPERGDARQRRNQAERLTHAEIGLKIRSDREIRGEAELSDAEAVQVIRKQAKQRRDSIESFEKGGRGELADKEKEELAILNAYLPRAMSPDELAKIVREAIAELGATSKAQMGEVMKALQAKAGGRADGKTLSAEVQKQLSLIR